MRAVVRLLGQGVVDLNEPIVPKRPKLQVAAEMGGIETHCRIPGRRVLFAHALGSQRTGDLQATIRLARAQLCFVKQNLMQIDPEIAVKIEERRRAQSGLIATYVDS